MVASQHITARERLVCWQPRFVLCGVCKSPTRGFGWQEPQRVSRPRASVWFCSMACQAFYSARARRLTVVDLTEEEKAAIRKAIKPVAETMEEVGWNVRLDGLSEKQIVTIIEVAIGGFQEAMRDIAAANKPSVEVPY
jgi:hypothetical protein